MEIIPALDLRHGKCVRLFQGDFTQETVFSEDPLAVARHWQAQGAQRLHVVDLDGALEGQPTQTDLITRIVRSVSIPVQVGGGVRSLEHVKHLLQLGVERIVLGTAAIEDPALVSEAYHSFPDAVAVSVDAKEGSVAVKGWTQTSDLTAMAVVSWMRSLGVQHIIYTDIARDGTLTEPNFEGIGRLIRDTGVPITVGGGISSLDHVQRLAGLGASGVIIGKALYTGVLDLRDAMNLAQGQDA